MPRQRKHSILSLIPLFEVMSARGVDPEPLLNKHHIDLSSMSGTALIDAKVEERIMLDALELLDDPCLGIKVGSQSTFASFGTFALLVMTAPNFKEAVNEAVQFQALSLLLMTYSLHFEKDYFELRYTLPDADPSLLPFIADRDFAGSFMFMKELIDNPRRYLLASGVARPKPDRELRALYRQIAEIDIEFDQPYSWFRLPASLLGKRLKHANVLAHKLYRVQAQELLRRFFPGSDDTLSQVRQLIAGYDQHFPTAADVAKHLGLSERTLRRKLDSAGRSYRELLDEHRRKRALNMLMTEDLPISQIAEALGYAESASFVRAFKRWTGLSPKHYAKLK